MKRKVLYPAIMILLVLAVLEGIGWLLCRNDDVLLRLRAILRGETIANQSQNTTSQAYLNYIPTPGLEHSGYVQHNQDGYRGARAALDRQPGTVRILFLGGSVVYSWRVDNPEDAYPAVTGKLLEQQLADGRKVEVINAGAPWLTTAEMLNYYLLKFRYYQPDVVVINEGGNDAEAIDFYKDYQPDYSHWRKSMTPVTALPAHSRWLLRSRLMSWLVIRLFYADIVNQELFVHDGSALPAKWFPPKTLATLQMKDYAYYNNLGSLVREVQHDSAAVILYEWMANPYDTSNVPYLKHHAFADSAMQMVAAEEQVPYLDFPAAQLQKSHWVDDCHLSAEGEKIKAAHLASLLLRILKNDTTTTLPPDGNPGP